VPSTRSSSRTRYDLLAPSNRVEDLLTEVDRDPAYRTYRDSYDAARGLFFFSITWGFEYPPSTELGRMYDTSEVNARS